VKKETDAAWTDIIVKGKNKMPSYDKKITDAESRTSSLTCGVCASKSAGEPATAGTRKNQKVSGPGGSFAGAPFCNGAYGSA